MRALTGLLLALALALAAVASPPGAATASAQSIPVAEAQEFLGDWNVALDADMPMTVRLNITDSDGQVAASLTAEGTTTAIENISRADETLILRFASDVQGQPMPIVVALRRDGDALRADVDVADGLMTIPGRATRR
jgi:hypothetical protein